MIKKIGHRINPKLTVAGILLTMCDSRTNLCKVITEQVTETLDRGTLYTKVAFRLAFFPENEQQMVYKIVKEKGTKLTLDMAIKLRSHTGTLTEALVRRYFSTAPIKKKCYKVPARIVEKYFQGMEPDKVDAIVEQALEVWFKNKG